MLPLIAAAFALGSAGAAASAAPALTEQDRADANCVAAITMVGGETDEKDQDGIASVLTYFVGKLKGRRPDLSMTDVLTPELVDAVVKELEGEILRCSQEAIEMGRDLEAAGDALTKAGY